MQPVASTSRAINVPEFSRSNFILPEKYGRYTGDGFVTKPPIQPFRRPGVWYTNTALELANIVYPDGSLKNSSIAQSKLNDETERAAAATKITELQQQLTFVPLAVRPQLQAQINELRQKYFPAQLVEEKSAARHGDVMAEMKDAKVSASSERADILVALRSVLAGSGAAFFSGSGTPILPLSLGGSASSTTPPSPRAAPAYDEKTMVDTIVKALPSSITSGSPTSLDDILNLVASRGSDPEIVELYKQTIGALESVATPSSDLAEALYKVVFARAGYDPSYFSGVTIEPTVTTASGALKSIEDQLGNPPTTTTTYSGEKTVVSNINDKISQDMKDKIGRPIATTAEALKLIDPADGTLDSAEKIVLFDATVNYLDKLKSKEMETPARVYLFQLALLEKGANPSLAASVQSGFSSVTKWKTAQEKVDEYLAARAKLTK